MALGSREKQGFGSNESAEDQGNGGIFAEINITPLTDIFLVLLIIFMVTSSVMSQLGVDVNLPQATKQVSQAQPEGVIVTLLPEGKMRVNQMPFLEKKEFSQFEVDLKNAFSKTKSRTVILEGDENALLGVAIEIMDHARKVGAEKFAIATSTPKGSKNPI